MSTATKVKKNASQSGPVEKKPDFSAVIEKLQDMQLQFTLLLTEADLRARWTKYKKLLSELWSLSNKFPQEERSEELQDAFNETFAEQNDVKGEASLGKNLDREPITEIHEDITNNQVLKEIKRTEILISHMTDNNAVQKAIQDRLSRKKLGMAFIRGKNVRIVDYLHPEFSRLWQLYFLKVIEQTEKVIATLLKKKTLTEEEEKRLAKLTTKTEFKDRETGEIHEFDVIETYRFRLKRSIETNGDLVNAEPSKK